jgi:hypothetical protein
MENNFIFAYQNVLSVSPLLLGGLAFLLVITNTARHELMLIINLLTMSVGLGMINAGIIKEAIYLIVTELTIVTIISIFRIRKCDC